MPASSGPTVPAGSRRFWLTVLGFALVNAGVWIAYIHHGQEWVRIPEIAQAEPTPAAPVSAAQVKATELVAECRAQGEPALRLRCEGEVSVIALRQMLSVEPAVPFVVEGVYDGVELRGQFKCRTRYLVKIAAVPAGVDAKRVPGPGVFSAFVGDRDSEVWFDNDQGYLGAQGSRTVVAHAINTPGVTVRIWRMYDNNVVAWRNAAGAYWSSDTEPYSQMVATRKLPVGGARNEERDVPLSLDDLLPAEAPRDGMYRLDLIIDRPDKPQWSQQMSQDDDENSWQRSQASAAFSLSDIGLSARQGSEGTIVWAVSLRTAKPIEGAQIRVYSDKSQLLGEATTGADGLATITGLHPAPGETTAVIIAQVPSAQPAQGRGLTWLDLRQAHTELGDADTGGRPYLRKGWEAYVYTERGVYRPGETVRLRVIMRGAGMTAAPSFPVYIQLRRPDLRNWQGRQVMLDADGAAGWDVEMPADVPTGRWTAVVCLPGEQNQPKRFGSAAFEVEEFMPNRMKVALELIGSDGKSPGERISTADMPLTSRVRADYLFGRPVTDQPATLAARVEPADFSPAQWQGWTFGDAAQTIDTLFGHRALGGRADFGRATLDGSGKASWPIDEKTLLTPQAKETDSNDKAPPYRGPWRVNMSASVIEEGGRAVTANREVTVDPVPYYIGLRRVDDGRRTDGRCSFEVALVGPDGRTAAGAAKLEASLLRQSWNTTLVSDRKGVTYRSTRLLDAAAAPMQVAMDHGRGVCQPRVAEEGTYVLQVRDTETGAMTSLEFSAESWAWEETVSREDPEKVELHVTGPKRLVAGQTANVVVASPFAGTLLLTVETDTVVWTKVMEMAASHVTVPVDVTEAWRPGAFVTATVLRAVESGGKWGTHRARGIARVILDNSDQRLDVRVSAPRELRPQTSLGLDVHVTDSAGRPVAGAAVTLAAVDEGICQLTNFATPDPLAFFTANRAHGVAWSDLYGQLMPEAEPGSAVGGDRGDEEETGKRHQTPVAARRVRPVALAWALAHTDADGTAHADFPLPPFVGQLRVMAVGYAASGVGAAEQAVTVRGPLLVQSSWPRFAAPGDKFSVPVVIFNNGPSAGDARVTVEMDADGPLELARTELGPMAISAGGQATACLEVCARRVGVARARLRATIAAETFQETVELPVRPASAAVTTAAYVSAEPGQPAQITIAGSMMPGTGHVRISATPWPMLRLSETLDYLDRYPYGCAEQTISTCIPLVYLSDLGRQIAPGVFDEHRMSDKVQAGITRLMAMQTAEGGLAMWPNERQTWPWVSIYAEHFLVEAKAAGHEVPEDFQKRLETYVRGLLAAGSDDTATMEQQAYACYVLALAGHADRAAMSRLAELLVAAKDPGEARLHLAAAYAVSGRKDRAAELVGPTVPVAGAARQLAGNLSTPVRRRAVAVETLLSIDPRNPALPAMAQDLADALNGGPLSTQDAALAAMAMGKYLRQAPRGRPYAWAQLARGASVLARSDGALAWEGEPAGDGHPMELRVSGEAGVRAYVSVIETGVPLETPADADHGLIIRRRYLDMRGTELTGDAVASGDLLQVELTLDTPGPLDNVVIDELLPAGLEIENPRLETEAGAQPTVGFNVARLDMRDDRLVAVGNLGGHGRLVYTARAVTSGTFVVPPAHAECMYDAGTYSTWGGRRALHVTAGGATAVARE